jgi:hypothetical protein
VAVHNILSKTDQAIVAYLRSLNIGTDENILPGKNAALNEQMPFVVCQSSSGRPTVPFSGQWTVQTEIEVHSNAAPDVGEDEAEMKETSDDLAGETIDAFMRFGDGEQSGSTLSDAITAAATGAGIAYTAFDVSITEVEQGQTEKSGEWVDKITLQITCIPRA